MYRHLFIGKLIDAIPQAQDISKGPCLLIELPTHVGVNELNDFAVKVGKEGLAIGINIAGVFCPKCKRLMFEIRRPFNTIIEQKESTEHPLVGFICSEEDGGCGHYQETKE